MSKADKKEQIVWRCACGKQMINGEAAKITKDGEERPIQICQKHPECGNDPMSREEWHRYRHLAAVAGEEAAETWREEMLPKLRERKAARAKFLSERED